MMATLFFHIAHDVAEVDLMLLHWPGDTASGTLQHGRPLPSCCRRFEQEERLVVGLSKCLESHRALKAGSYF